MSLDNTWAELPSGKRVNQDWLGSEKDDGQYQRMLKHAQPLPAPALCRCLPALKLQLAIRERDGRFHLARYPGTGHQHAPTCTFFAPNIPLTGRRAYAPDAITETADGFHLRLGYGLGETAQVISNANLALHRSQQSAGGGRAATTALGLLHFLWETSGSNRRGANASDKKWFMQVTKLHAAVQKISVARHHLSDHFLALPPRPGKLDAANAAVIARNVGKRLVVVGRLSSIYTQAGSHALVISGFRDLATKTWFPIEAQQLASLMNSFPIEFAALSATDRKGQIVIITVCNVTRKGPKFDLAVLDAALMWTTDQFIPCASSYEFAAAEELVRAKRAFSKPLRYDAHESEVFPDFELLDMGADSPYPMEVYGRTDQPYLARKAEKKAYYDTHYAGRHWLWEAAAGGPMPPLPPPVARPVPPPRVLPPDPDEGLGA